MNTARKLYLVKPEQPAGPVRASKMRHHAGGWVAEEDSPAWWRGDTFPRLRDVLELMAMRPGQVEPGTRPPDPSNEAPARVGVLITNLYHRKAHLYGSRCQVLQGRGVVTDVDLDTLDVRTPLDFRELATRKPMQCCGWCLKLAGA